MAKRKWIVKPMDRALFKGLISVFFLGLWIFTIKCFAEDCALIRLDAPGPWGVPEPNQPRERWRGSMQHIPVTSQDGTGICYAFAASQALDAWRFSQASPDGDQNYFHRTSPTQIAAGWKASTSLDAGLTQVALNFGRHDTNIDMGMICGAIDYAKEHGSCDSRAVEGWSPRDPRRVNQAASIRYIRERMRGLRGHKGSCDATGEGASPSATKTPGWVNPLLSVPLAETTIDAVNAAYEAESAHINTCPRQAISKALSCKTFAPLNPFDDRKKALTQELDRLLNRPAPVQPVGITFCAEFLWKENAKDWGVIDAAMNYPACHWHVALIIGRRKDPKTGECQYLLRNSWGTECGRYPKKYEESCEEAKMNGTVQLNDGGNLWVGRDVIMGSSFYLSYLEKN